MSQKAATERLEPMNALVGKWRTEAHHASYPDVVRGHAVFEWLDGGHFLVLRWDVDHPDFPNSISVIGSIEPDADPTMHYFDSRGVARVYQFKATAQEWGFSRDWPGFSQRYTATFNEDRSEAGGPIEKCLDDENWELDFPLRWIRIG
jgi:hypothetical protein